MTETETRAEIARRIREEVLDRIDRYDCCGCSTYEAIAQDCLDIAEGES